MNAILGYAQLLQLEEGHPLDGHQRERVARIEAAGWHLVTLINDVLDLSTIESGNARIQLVDVDVGLVINESIRLLAPQAENAKVTLALALPQDLPTGALSVKADATRLRQVLVNIIGNAIKYNLENGRVDIGVRIRAPEGEPAPDGGQAEPERLVIEIVDTGRGMTDAQLARLFSAFDRLGLESGPIEGTGIGLVISRRLVERMGGEIAIDSRPDVGTRVTDVSGLDVAQWMRTMPPLARIPVVVVSADSTQSQRDAATVAGVRAHLAKPIRLHETLRLIDELLPGAK